MRAKKIDVNQRDIVRELRSKGYSVAITSAQGQGFPDICVGYNGQNFLFEIKDPNKPPSQRKLTPDEKCFHDSWSGQIEIILTSKDAIAIIEK